VFEPASTDHLGDRFWGQVWAFPGSPRELHRRGEIPKENGTDAGKGRRQAVFLRSPADGRILHGKEGVDGSSPSEGLKESPANGHITLPASANCVVSAGTRRVHFGTGGHTRARATSRDAARDVLETLDRDRPVGKFLQTGGRVLPDLARLLLPPSLEGVSPGSRAGLGHAPTVAADGPSLEALDPARRARSGTRARLPARDRGA
jgi:hypothetical protein